MKKFSEHFWPERIFIFIFGSLLGLVLLVFFINAFDEDLSPEAKALLAEPPPNQIRPDQNLYLALIGLNAPQDKSPIAFAQEEIARHKDALAAKAAGLATPLTDRHGEKSSAQEMRFKGEGAVDFANLKTPLEKKAAIEKLIRDNHVLYQRYLALRNSAGYDEPGSDVPEFMVPTHLRHLITTISVSRIVSLDQALQETALNDLEEDIKTWRKVLAGNGSPNSKLQALSLISDDCLIISAAIADDRLDLSKWSPYFDRIIAQLDFAGEGMSNTFSKQSRTMASALEGMQIPSSINGLHQAEDGWFENFFLKRNATINLIAENLFQLRKVVDSPPSEYRTKQLAYSNWLDENLSLKSQHFYNPRYVYNPVGRFSVFLNSLALMAQTSTYYDFIARRRAVKLAYEIRLQHIQAEEIPAFMQEHPEWATHPVDGKSFSWNEEEGLIEVVPRVSAASALKGNPFRFKTFVWPRGKSAGDKNKP